MVGRANLFLGIQLTGDFKCQVTQYRSTEANMLEVFPSCKISSHESHSLASTHLYIKNLILSIDSRF